MFNILQIESRNNKLELQSVSNKVLIEELDKLVERLSFPPEVYPIVKSVMFFHHNYSSYTYFQ